MELYTLTSHFLPKDTIDEFVSAIWTERYSPAGDVQLVVLPVPSMIEKLAPGTFLGLRGTSEIMLIESHSIENNLLTVTGSSMPDYLKHRMGWFANPAYDGSDSTVPLVADRSEDTTAGQLISSVVSQMVIAPTPFGSYWAPANLNWAAEIFPGLALGWTDANGAVKRLTFPLGSLYENIQKLAQDEGLGIKLYLESASYSSGFVFKFATYRGKDRTSEQTVRTMVRLTPKMDSLNDVKEIRSLGAYKNVFYVNYKNAVSTHYIPGLAVPTGFDRREILVDAPDIYIDPSHVAAFREQVARNTLANHVYIQAVDGRVSSKIPYTYGVDYGLGDVIELQGYTEVFSKARITEYIRSQDQFGEQEYPTLSVLDPLFIGYMPDLEPGNPDWPWETDPDYDLDLDDPETHRKRRKKDQNPKDPRDPNPDPDPDFTPPPPDLGPFPAPSASDPDSRYAVVGYYPDQNNGEALAYVTFDGRLLPAWTYTTEDPNAESEWHELIPKGWTFDHQKVIVLSEDDKTNTEEYPWTRGYAFWLMDLEGNATRLTDTIAENARAEGLLGMTHGWTTPGALWCGSDDNWHWYMASEKSYFVPLGGGGGLVTEYVYADGTYTTDPAALGHGDLLDNGPGPIELYASYGGRGEGRATISEMTRILFKEDFPPDMRWSRFIGPYPSPDGEKLLIGRQPTRPSTQFILSSGAGSVAGGTFTLTVGVFGNLISGYFTTPDIPYNATAEQVYSALLTVPYLQDPRGHGYPYVPYYLSSPLQNGGQLQMTFDVVPPQGVYIATHTENLVLGFLGSVYAIRTHHFQETGEPSWYICDYNGDNLEDIGLDIITNVFGGWSPDSTKIHALVPSVSGNPYCRWLNYDVATGDITYPLDYSGDTMASDGSGTLYGPLQSMPIFSPNGEKIAWILRPYDGTKSLWTADADGSNKTEIYRQETTFSPSDQDVLFFPWQAIAWSFDSTKLAIIDERDAAPVWVMDLVSNEQTKIWPGSGWENSDDQKWLYDIQSFDGG
jgi:hypothetical protein